MLLVGVLFSSFSGVKIQRGSFYASEKQNIEVMFAESFSKIPLVVIYLSRALLFDAFIAKETYLDKFTFSTTSYSGDFVYIAIGV